MYIVVRFMIVGINTEQHSIERKDTLIEAEKRWHSIIASDIDRSDLLYELTQIIRDDGVVVRSQVIDNRIYEED